MPEKVFVKDLAMVTAGLAKDVDDVHQYADMTYKATLMGTTSTLFLPANAITVIKPKVAISSDMVKRIAPLSVDPSWNSSRPKIPWAKSTPKILPKIWNNVSETFSKREPLP